MSLQAQAKQEARVARPWVMRQPVVYWMWRNLFSTPLNTILTLASIWLLWSIVAPFVDWAIIRSIWVADSRDACRAADDGACWAIVTTRIDDFVFGRYPDASRWRPALAFFLFIAALVPVLWENAPHRGKGLLFACAYPLIAAWLMLGGLGLDPVDTKTFGGFLLTMVIGITGIVLSLPLGILLALGRRSTMPVMRMSCTIFIEFIRGVPLITLLFIASVLLSYFLPPGTSFDLLLRVLIMVTLFASAYMAEVIRGGFQGLSRGQYEAAEALGLSYWRGIQKVVLPQVLKVSIPGIVNSFIGLYKDTTLVIIIGLFDPIGVGRVVLADAGWAGLAAEVYLFCALFFFISCFMMSRYSLWLERSLERGHGS